MFEKRDADVRVIGKIAFYFGLIFVLCLWCISLFFRHLRKLDEGVFRKPEIATGLQQPPAPRLQVNGAEELSQFREAQSRKLHSFGWIDKTRGTTHVPIEKAMEQMTHESLE